MQSVIVRSAASADIGVLADLRASWSAGADVPASEGFVDMFGEWFETELGQRRFWIAERRSVDGRPTQAIGMVNLLLFDRMPSEGRPPGRWGYLANMFVREQERNEGVGAALVTAVMDFADERGFEKIVLNPTDRSRPFYARSGFSPAGDGLFIRRPRPDSP